MIARMPDGMRRLINTVGTPGKFDKGVQRLDDDAVRKQKSTKTRAERKSETAEARKKGELVPAGEGPVTPKK